jgi:glutathione synthase/RimK-type ligase-like ATP-grasp enzyme
MHWAATTRLCLAMATGGFEVRALAPDIHALHDMRAIGTRQLGRTRRDAIRSIVQAIEEDSPDLLIPADDRAIDLIRVLYKRAVRGHVKVPSQKAALIEASLGAPSTFLFSHLKSHFVSFARDEGLLVPRTQIIRNLGDLRTILEEVDFPVVIKRDESFGGQGVRTAVDATDAEQAFTELQRSGGYVAALKQAVKKVDIAYLGRLFREGPAITLQEYIKGRPANRAVVCYRGEVLAGLSVEVLCTSETNGPATVVRAIESIEMATAVARIVRRLCLSGFVGFDFMLEEGTGRAYLIEMNGRPTQICHFALDDKSDLIGALAASFMSPIGRKTTSNIGSSPIALFPQEIWRDPNSDFLRSAYHDVPPNEPAFMAAYRQAVAPEPPTWYDIAKQGVRNLRRSLGRSNKSDAAVSAPNGSSLI